MARFRLFLIGLPLVLAGISSKAEDVPSFRNDVIMQVPLGHLEAAEYVMRATVTTLAPGARIPAHVHEVGGIRYMLDGTMTIAWKDGRTQTFTTGSTYYEGPGQNHPTGSMAAFNPSEKPARLLIVELVPAN
jgi:quercetin dioxygenase-like cupin family protein